MRADLYQTRKSQCSNTAIANPANRGKQLIVIHIMVNSQLMPESGIQKLLVKWSFSNPSRSTLRIRSRQLVGADPMVRRSQLNGSPSLYIHPGTHQPAVCHPVILSSELMVPRDA